MPKSLSCVLLAGRHHGQAEGVRGLLAAAFGSVVTVAGGASLLGGPDPTRRGGRETASSYGRRIGRAFRALPAPVIGRVCAGAFWLDVRSLGDEVEFAAQLARLKA